jgi:hypothetical protein
MEKLKTTLSAQDRVILFCVATGVDQGAIGITVNAMQSMAIRGFIAHNRESGPIRSPIAAALRLRRCLKMLG